MKILIVEDEAVFSSAIVSILKRGGYAVDVVESIGDAETALSIYGYDLILLDRHLPDGDGLGLLQTLRRRRSDVPVILMSAEMRSVEQRIVGLEGGADDYMTKPLDGAELLARVRALLRRPKELARSEIVIGNLCFNLAARSITIAGHPVAITRRELGILEHLVRAHGRVVLREQIEQNVYGFDEAISINAIDVSMHRLRRILLKHRASVAVHTVRGLGYMIQEKVLEDV